MIRVLIYLVILAALAFGLAQIAELPGMLSIKWPWWPLNGQTIEMRPLVALALGLAILIGFYLLVAILRFVFRIPSLMAFTARARRQTKGFAAVSRGMIAAGAGDARAAERASREAIRLLGPTPLALLLQAQSAQLSGNRQAADSAFRQMIENPGTRVIGLRGLYLEARRDGDDEKAHAFAQEAHTIAPLPWAGQAILERHTMGEDWRAALSVVEANMARKAIDKATGNRQRAVLKAAIGRQIAGREPDEALQLAREAIKLAPGLVPAYALAGRLLARRGDIRRGAKILESGWKASPHPEIAAAYLDLRPGDSTSDRLARAQTLARINSGHVESRLLLARAALDARDFVLARKAVGPLVEGAAARPTVRICLFMADLEETEHGSSGRVREWLARAARAPRDPMWIADGIATDTWSPASPVTGRLDAFVWEAPTERLLAPDSIDEREPEEEPKFIPSIPAAHDEAVVIEPQAAPPEPHAIAAAAATPSQPGSETQAAPAPAPKSSPAPAPAPESPAVPEAAGATAAPAMANSSSIPQESEPNPEILPQSQPAQAKPAEPGKETMSASSEATAAGAARAETKAPPAEPVPGAAKTPGAVKIFAGQPDDPGPR